MADCFAFRVLLSLRQLVQAQAARFRPVQRRQGGQLLGAMRIAAVQRIVQGLALGSQRVGRYGDGARTPSGVEGVQIVVPV